MHAMMGHLISPCVPLLLWVMSSTSCLRVQILQPVRDKYAHLFSGDHTMRLFMWQTDLVTVAKFLDECLELLCTAGPLDAGQASDQP